MKSANNGGILNGSLQMLHVHVFLVAPLGAGYMAQPGTDQHQSRVTVREASNHAGAAADLPVQPFNHIIGADTSPVLTGKIAVGQRFLNAILHLFGGFLQLHGAQFLHHRFCLFPGGFLALLGMDRLEHLPRKGDAMDLSGRTAKTHPIATSFTLERGVTENTLW